MSIFYKQIKFTAPFVKQLVIAVVLAVILSFILIYLEPLNTNNFHSKHKSLLLSGYGFIIGIIYLIHSRIETHFYIKQHKKWVLLNEVISLLVFFLISGFFAYLYNEIYINQNSFSLKYLYEYQKQIVLIFMPILGFFVVFLRAWLGKIINPKKLHQITLKGSNKKELLTVQKNDVLYIKSSENYIEIYFLKQGVLTHKTFRNTLSQIANQADFLTQCHRSYLVNLSIVKELNGNSQKAYLIFFKSNETVPVSKSYYKSIKNILSDRHKK